DDFRVVVGGPLPRGPQGQRKLVEAGRLVSRPEHLRPSELPCDAHGDQRIIQIGIEVAVQGEMSCREDRSPLANLAETRARREEERSQSRNACTLHDPPERKQPSAPFLWPVEGPAESARPSAQTAPPRPCSGS